MSPVATQPRDPVAAPPGAASTVDIGLVDGHPVTLRGMQSVYDAVPGMRVVAMHTDPELLDASITDVIVIDAYATGDRPCLSVIAAFARQAKVIVSAHRWTPELVECLEAGALTYIEKRSSPEQFVETVRLVADGKAVPQAAAKMRDSTPLSPREHSVLTHISRGLTHDQTARRLGISRHTVDTYVKRARAKMKLGNKAELTRSMLLSTTRSVNL